MTYRGFEIDHIRFNSKAEIDEFIKAEAVKAYKQALRFFYRDGSMEASIFANRRAERLHRVCGMSWTDIESLEFDVLGETA